MALLLKAACILSVFLSISFGSAHRFLSDQASEPLHHGSVKKINPNGGKGVGVAYDSGTDPACGDDSITPCVPCDDEGEPCCEIGFWRCCDDDGPCCNVGTLICRPPYEHQRGSTTAAAKEVQEAINIAGEEPPTDHDHYNKVSEPYPTDHADSNPSITISGNAHSKPAAVSINSEPYPPDHAHSKP